MKFVPCGYFYFLPFPDNANKKTKNANAINILNVLTVKPPQKIENISSLHKDTVGPQKGLEAEHEMAAPVKQICAEEALQNNTATGAIYQKNRKYVINTIFQLNQQVICIL